MNPAVCCTIAALLILMGVLGTFLPAAPPGGGS